MRNTEKDKKRNEEKKKRKECGGDEAEELPEVVKWQLRSKRWRQSLVVNILLLSTKKNSTMYSKEIKESNGRRGKEQAAARRQRRRNVSTMKSIGLLNRKSISNDWY